MNYKKLLIIISLGISQISFAESVDYTKGNSNPFVKYEYKSDAQWNSMQISDKLENSTDYFNNRIQNPIAASKSKKGGKYRHLIDNSSQISGCWDKAAVIYGVDPWLLMAIAKTESSFNINAINVNKNKSVDIGMMQINTIWLPTLKKFGIQKEHLFNPCTSIFVGAWIVAQNIKSFGYNQDGIGAYNSPGNIKIRRNYAKKVYSSYAELVADFYVKK